MNDIRAKAKAKNYSSTSEYIRAAIRFFGEEMALRDARIAEKEYLNGKTIRKSKTLKKMIRQDAK